MNNQPFLQSVMGAVNATPDYGPSVNATATNGGLMDAAKALASLQGQGDIAKQAQGSFNAVSGQDMANQQAARAEAKRRAAEELALKEAEAKKLTDPKNYLAQVNDRGGYDYFDPAGNSIPLVTYAKATNKRISDIIKDSEDLNDQDFKSTYDLVTEAGRIMQYGTPEARDKFLEENPEFNEVYGTETPFSEIVADLKETYPQYFRGQEMQRPELNDRTLNTIPGDKKNENFLSKLYNNIRG